MSVRDPSHSLLYVLIHCVSGPSALVPISSGPPVLPLPFLSNNPWPFPSRGSHDFQLLPDDIDDTEANKYLVRLGTNHYRCIGPRCLHHMITTLQCQITCPLTCCDEEITTSKENARVHLRCHYGKQHRFYCTGW